MLEDFTMEKKLNRSSQSPKGIAESKKNQDVPNGKHNRNPRKRDLLTPKYETSKKPGTLQKNKSYNKRSSTRGYYHDGGGKNSELVSEFDEDFDLKKSKKRNLTHLLNFHCKPRDGEFHASRYFAPRPFIHHTIRDLMTTQKHKYNKEQYLQANCQFVVRADEDYSIYMGDPDILVDWGLIEQIRVLSSEPVSCPICLGIPIAAKITRCGHIYCWPCILHYLALTDKSWRKCPICFEAVHRKDLKSVKPLDQIQYSIGNEITFHLIKRERGSTVTVPATEITRIRNALLFVSENQHTTVYSKLLLADHENILKIIEDEEFQLNVELNGNLDTPELCFIQEAVELLNERRAKLYEEIGTKPEYIASGSSFEDDEFKSAYFSMAETSHEFVDETRDEDDKDDSFSNNVFDVPSCSKSYENTNDDIDTVSLTEDTENSINLNTSPYKDHFFYQAIDGQQIFLHPINARMLEREYKSLECGPPLLTGTILEIESGSVTEELRKRLRYLQHLPLTCQFQVVEINLNPPIISLETKAFFKDQLEKRNRDREKRAKEERKLEKKAEQMAKKQFGRGHSPPRRLRLDSYHHFPECGSDTPPNLSPRTQSATSSRTSSPSNMSRRSTSPLNTTMNMLTLNTNTFAQKLKDNNKNGGWRKRATASESEANGSHSRNLISDAVEAALIKAQQEKANNQISSKNQITNKKKKKKQKPVPICSIGMIYNSH